MSAAPPSKPNVKSLSCPNCGGTVELRGMGRALSAVCIQCLSILDTSTAQVTVLQQFQAKERFQPLIPLGTRGKIKGDPFEVIGFQVREMMAEGVPYNWSEYVLFNPYKGFRYLTEYNGHWNSIIILKETPATQGGNSRPIARHLSQTYRHFQHYAATTIYVMGEFPWQTRVGESASCDDYIAPPLMLSCEQTPDEVGWSLGEYMDGKVLWSNFGLKGEPPQPQGVFANQPGPPSTGRGKAWMSYLMWAGILTLVQFLWAGLHSNSNVFEQKYTFDPRGRTEQSFVTGEFDLKGRTSTVEVAIRTNLENNWTYFNLALVNSTTGQALDFSRNVSYYSGRDSDGSWSEGSRGSSVVLPSIASGKYYLRVEPERETSATDIGGPVSYEIKVRRDVITWSYYWYGMLLLLIPPIWKSIRGGGIESQRWAESDYGSAG